MSQAFGDLTEKTKQAVESSHEEYIDKSDMRFLLDEFASYIDELEKRIEKLEKENKT